MDESMIGRVAEAMRLRGIDRGHPVQPVVLRHLAVAAIEAMRAPTPDMYIAAYAANGGKWTSAEFEPPPKECWQAMIDAALSEKP